jgi:calcineurin-like phosphoesterase family protein
MPDMWFTSDTHYGHTNIIRYCGRPFTSTKEMDEAMVERWNKVVKPSDFVYHLGDLIMGQRIGERATALRARLNGKITLVLGNHDRGIKVYHDAGFDAVVRWRRLWLDAGLVWMRHHPPQRPMDEHAEYRLMLCGHVHEKWKQKGKLVNVGVDQWDFTPVHLDTLLHITSDEYIRATWP